MVARTSVVIPCYNVQDYLQDALDSVRTQTLPVLEIVLVDDGSLVPLQPPANWDGPPLKLIRTDNRGLPAARNLGLAHCSGELIAFLDADDLWHPRKVEAQTRALADHPGAVASYTRCLDQPGFFGFGPYPPPDVSDDEFLAVLWYNLFFPPSAVAVRREVLNKVGGFREDLGNGEDIELWLRLLSCGSFVQVPQALTSYRQHAQQFTKNIRKKMLGSKQARRAMIELHADRLVCAGLGRRTLWDSYRNDILLVYYRRELAAARWLLWDYWLEHPADIGVLKYALLSLFPAEWLTKLRGRTPLPKPASGQSTVADTPAPPGDAGWSLALRRIRHAVAR
jgi:glycosyltransferase involved in cell wall biosynthesis